MIAAIIPAAGLSSRMGGQVIKPLLPWRHHTVIEEIITTLLTAGLSQIVVVTGHQHQALEAALASCPVRCLFNPNYASGEMLSSLQVGLQALPAGCSGALVALADQPQMQVSVVQKMLKAFAESDNQAIVIPSYQMRRGHPVVLPRRLWAEVLALPQGATLRAVLQAHVDEIRYVVVDTPTVLADLDTPQQYEQALKAIQ